MAQKDSHLFVGFLILSCFLGAARLNAGPKKTFQGLDNGSPCFLYIHQEIEEVDYQLREGEVPRYTVEVSTSYQHNGQGLGHVVLKFAPNARGKLLEWSNPETGEFVRVLLQEEAPSLENPKAYRIKWIHHDHLHDATCSDLKRVE